jgi:hypothetical protein
VLPLLAGSYGSAASTALPRAMGSCSGAFARGAAAEFRALDSRGPVGHVERADVRAGCLATKRGLAPALHSGDPAYSALPGYFTQRLGPALGSLLEAAIAAGEIRADISAKDLLDAVASLCQPMAGDGAAYSQRMVALLIDGLRYGAGSSKSRS